MLSCDVSQLINNPVYLSSLKEKDIDDLAEKLKPFLEDKVDSCITNICNKTLSSKTGEGVVKQAFYKLLQERIRDGIYIYLAHKHWESNKNIVTYLQKILNRSYAEFVNDGNNYYQSEYKCVACNYYGQKNVILSALDSKTLYCNNCANEMLYVEPSKKLDFLQAFQTFSKKGFTCNHCKRFVPQSHLDHSKNCPYPNCGKEITEFNKTNFKKSQLKQIYVSDEYIYNNATYDDVSYDKANEELLLDQIHILIEEALVECRDKCPINSKNHCLYQAFLNTLNDHPDEFCFYIVNGKKNSKIPIQASIYQRFCDLIEANRQDVQVKDLNLFNGYRRFWGFVENDNKIRYSLQEILINGEWVKDTDKSFIAKIDKIITEEDKDITNEVSHYSFSNIHFNDSIKPLTNCCVYYNSIFPSHTKENMIAMQRIKKQITDLTMKRINTGEEYV